MQCIILAGGLGTRMRPLTETCPKTLLPAQGRPFAWHQLHWLAAQGISEVIYSIGHQGGMIRRYWADEPSPVASIRYVDEGRQLRGTAGALRLAREAGVLAESFFVIYGDSFLPVEFSPIWRAFQASCQPALMTVLRNDGRWDRSNVVFRNGEVIEYDKTRWRSDMTHIDFGISVLSSSVFSRYGETRAFDLADICRDLARIGQLAAVEVSDRFYEVGSVQGIQDTEAYLSDQLVDT